MNRLGTVDLLIAARHGNVNADLLAHAVRPRAIVTNNGTRKGAQPEAMKIFFTSPVVQDVWQIHFRSSVARNIRFLECSSRT
jgi:hypothetical protein